MLADRLHNSRNLTHRRPRLARPDRCRHQPRRLAQAGQTPAAEDRLRLHRGRRSTTRTGSPATRTPSAAIPAGAALRRRCHDPGSEHDPVRQDLLGPGRDRADRGCRAIPARRRHDAGRGGQGRQRAVHHVGRRHGADRGSGQAGARPRLVPALRRPRPQDLRGHDPPRRRCRPLHAGDHRRRAGQLQPRAQPAQRLRAAA